MKKHLQLRLIPLLLLTFILSLLHTASLKAQSPNARQAREIFDKTWNLAFGPQGSTFTYKVNIIGLYKTEGTIWQKGKKSRYESDNSKAWNDGTTFYVVKKKEVHIYDADDERKDKYASKFSFERDNYNYSIAEDKDGLMLTLKLKSSKLKGVSEVKLLVNRQTFVPLRLRVKVGLVHATVNISHFRSGGLDESLFVFPKDRYKDLKVDDKRRK